MPKKRYIKEKTNLDKHYIYDNNPRERVLFD
jgi:hypothetical protein